MSIQEFNRVAGLSHIDEGIEYKADLSLLLRQTAKIEGLGADVIETLSNNGYEILGESKTIISSSYTDVANQKPVHLRVVTCRYCKDYGMPHYSMMTGSFDMCSSNECAHLRMTELSKLTNENQDLSANSE